MDKVAIKLFGMIRMASPLSGNVTSVLKPIFHGKLGSRSLTNGIEMNTNNMKCTWPSQQFGTTYIPLARIYVFAFWVTQILCFALGVTQILAFLNTNMLDLTRVFLYHSGI